YKEMFQFLDGALKYEEAVSLIQQNTRRFAKRQLTWFRSDPRIQWIPVERDWTYEVLADRIIARFQKSVQKVH
ncbi:MAG: tRNA (adenosine(37)-N6)-dimethylallyltransferase MiaA, partial [Bacteroidota bacterium]